MSESSPNMARWSPAEMWASPRVWATLSNMSNRGVGFIVSLTISRLLNTQSLALYISTVIAAATVATPIVQMLFNAGTVGGARTAPMAWLRRFLRLELMVVALVVPVLVGVLGAMQWGIAAPLSREVGSSTWWLVVVGVSAIASQLLVAALSGLLNGMNRQLGTYRALAFVSMGTMLLSFPSVWVGGLRGAWLILICNSWIPVALLCLMVLRALRGPDEHLVAPGQADLHDLPDPAGEAWRQIRLCLPNAIGVAASGLAGWLCTIKLVSMYHGAAGVATVAIANQWMTLILVPVTSWGGVQLRELVEARKRSQGGGTVASGADAESGLAVLRRLLTRNLLTTGLLVVVVALGASVLEATYKMQGRGLVELLWISGAVALAATVYGVIESMVIAWERQWLLMRLMFVGLTVQILITLVFIDHSLLVVQWGCLMAWVTMITIGWAMVRKQMTEDAS